MVTIMESHRRNCEERVPMADWDQVKEVVAQALELTGSARERFLDETCETDTQLRAEVESLVAADAAADGFLNTHDAGAASTQIHSLEGRALGAYRVGRMIGYGGMGTVYLASRADGVYRKEVAVKVVHSAFTSSESMARFRAERQILADIEHPNIARLIDGGATEDGFAYLVMEYVQGAPIDAYCDALGISIDHRAVLVGKVCRAVEHAHAHNVVHRDIKPDNILIGDDGEPKLLDFGIAKILASDSGDPSIHTVFTRARGSRR
ncbi:MAG: protein kinase [Acidobacteria bacterium]|nr:protein kinase [Acidobacteriota bacterium]